MLFSVQKMCEACAVLEASAYAGYYVDEVFRQVVPAHAHLDREGFVAFVRSLPEVRKQRKIMLRLNKILDEHGLVVRDLSWWDISISRRVLFGVLVSDNQEIPFRLFWKVRGRKSDPDTFVLGSWSRFVEAPAGWCYDIESATYRQMKKAFGLWLHDRGFEKIPSASIMQKEVAPTRPLRVVAS